MKFKQFFIGLIIAVSIISCESNYNKTIHWADNLESELTIEDVKKLQPYFIEVDWENPKSIDNRDWYMITKIKGNHDLLGMSHFLVFVNDKYQYSETKK